MKYYALVVAVALFITGCSTPKIGFVSSEPYFDNKPPTLNKKINIYIEDVDDTLLMTGDWNMNTKLTAFKTSFKDILKKTFQASFSEVSFTEKIPENQLTLHIYRIYPFWEIDKSTIYGVGNDAYLVYAATFEVAAILYHEGEGIIKINDKAVSGYKTNGAKGMELKKATVRVYADGLREAAGKIHELILTPDVVKKLTAN